MLVNLETKRLLLRKWQAEDLNEFAQINQDPKVMEFMPKLLSLDESKAFIDKLNHHFDKHGFGLWAAVLKETQELIGYVGLNVPEFEAHFTPCVEIGWRLAFKHWGNGYATEAAKAVLDVGFNQIKLKEIVSFTVPANIRSISVMEKIGMQRDLSGDFYHPKLPKDHPLALHILYRIKN